MIIKKFSDPEKAGLQLGRDLSEKLTKAKKAGQKILLLLSGGSALRTLEYVNADALGDNLTIGMLDERYESANRNNNFIELTKTNFFRSARKAKTIFFDSSVKEYQSQKQLANKIEKFIRDWLKKNKNGIIMATLGMGVDGHIAGIMPFPENEKLFKRLFIGTNWIASYDAGDKNPYRFRITASITFLKQLDETFAFICGQEKADAFKKISAKTQINIFPAKTLSLIKNITVYTDINV